jgi:hypothetical protein
MMYLVLGIWYCHNEAEDTLLWATFQQDMHAYGCLRLTFLSCSLNVNFLDFSLTLDFDGSVTSAIFEKKLNLHMYLLPPHLSHPPGALRGLIFGMTYHIYRFCSEPRDRRHRVLALCYRHLLGRGHSSYYRVQPLLEEALSRSIQIHPPPPIGRPCTTFQMTASSFICHITRLIHLPRKFKTCSDTLFSSPTPRGGRNPSARTPE